MAKNETTVTGGCLCGGVRYSVKGPLRDVVACHCSQCRRTSGHYVAATGAPTKDVTLLSSDTLTWYASSDRAERGFCRHCGGHLFWRPTKGDRSWTSIMAGSVDPPTHLKTVQHIFVADKSDYYTINDGAPQLAQWEH
jgi:hypothetical protein